jgi:hypothetical protein
VFFGALAQSALGTGAAYVALLVIAYQRFHSPWAISFVLLADFLPAIVLGPLLGSATDRWSRRSCAVAADGLRAVAFVGIAMVGSFPATVAFALLAGTGTALFKPAILAGLPTLVRPERAPAATALYGAITDAGYIGGPALAAPLLALFGPGALLAGNGATFGISALLLSRLPFGAPPSRDGRTQRFPARSLLHETKEGLRATAGMPGIRILVAASATAMFFGGVWNVVELPFATNALGTGASGYSVLVAILGAGFVVGSLRGSAGGDAALLKRRYVQGLALSGMGGIVVAVMPSLLLVLPPLALAGFGNGYWVVHERLLIQSQVPQPFQGRVFGLAEGVVAGGFALAFVTGGAMTALVGERPLILATGVGEILLASLALALLRGRWTHVRLIPPVRDRGRVLGDDAGPLGQLGQVGQLHAGKQGAHFVDRTGFWLTLLDDLQEPVDDSGVELRPGVGD